jgi:hypothetical protein
VTVESPYTTGLALVSYNVPQGATCNPPTGSYFSGTTTVTCTDGPTGKVLGTFRVIVNPKGTTPTTIPAQGPTTTPSPSPPIMMKDLTCNYVEFGLGDPDCTVDWDSICKQSPTGPGCAEIKSARETFCKTQPSATVCPRTTSTSPAIIKNVNNNQVTFSNGGFAVQDRTGAVTSTPDCSTQDKTISLGPSPMQSGGARLLAAFDPCILTDGTVALNLPDGEGIELIAANLQGDQTSQSVVVPMQKMSPITQGQTLYIVDLAEQITGSDPASGNPTTLNGNINALFLRNNGGQNVEFSADNSIAINAILKR